MTFCMICRYLIIVVTSFGCGMYASCAPTPCLSTNIMVALGMLGLIHIVLHVAWGLGDE